MAQSACRFLIMFFFSLVYCVTSGSGFVCLWINIWIKSHFHFSLYVGFILLLPVPFCTVYACRVYCKHLWICVALNRVELTVQTHRDLMYVFRFSLSLFWVDTHTRTHSQRYTSTPKKTQPTSERTNKSSWIGFKCRKRCKNNYWQFQIVLSCPRLLACLLVSQYSISTCNNIEAILLFPYFSFFLQF